ncbi:MAG TPA: hypothetical protein VIG47_12600 [Gemmatimonadaceae bacterium]|jgi:hypothetical protein
MPKHSAQILVRAKPEDVFAEVPATWMSQMEQISAGPIGLHTRFALRTDRIRYWDVIEYEPPHRFAMAHRPRENSVPVVYRYVIVSDSTGTRVRLVASMTYPLLTVIFKLGLFAPIMLPIVKAQLRKIDLDNLLTDLKRRAEIMA